jgi:hypothetical protein
MTEISLHQTIMDSSLLIHISNTGYSPAINELSFGALRKAQRTLDRTHVQSDDGVESDGSDSTGNQRLDDSSDEESKEEVESGVKGSKRDAASTARKNKHA